MHENVHKSDGLSLQGTAKGLMHGAAAVFLAALIIGLMGSGILTLYALPFELVALAVGILLHGVGTVACLLERILVELRKAAGTTDTAQVSESWSEDVMSWR